MAEIKNLLDRVIETEIQNLGSLSSGSDEKSAAIRDLAALHKLRIEEIKAQTDADEKRERRAMDSEQHKADLALREQQAQHQEAQQRAELSLKERQADGDDADRQMRGEQHKADLALKERQIEGDTAERTLKEQQMQLQAEQQRADLALREREADGKDADRAREETLQARQVRDSVIDRYVRVGVAAAELVLPLVFYGVWMKKGLKFEETGTYSSTTFRNLFNRFKPTKKG